MQSYAYASNAIFRKLNSSEP